MLAVLASLSETKSQVALRDFNQEWCRQQTILVKVSKCQEISQAWAVNIHFTCQRYALHVLSYSSALVSITNPKEFLINFASRFFFPPSLAEQVIYVDKSQKEVLELELLVSLHLLPCLRSSDRPGRYFTHYRRQEKKKPFPLRCHSPLVNFRRVAHTLRHAHTHVHTTQLHIRASTPPSHEPLKCKAPYKDMLMM